MLYTWNFYNIVYELYLNNKKIFLSNIASLWVGTGSGDKQTQV